MSLCLCGFRPSDHPSSSRLTRCCPVSDKLRHTVGDKGLLLGDKELHSEPAPAAFPGPRGAVDPAPSRRERLFEAHFDAPDRFDVTRSPNDHLGFGGGGPHFCLGANLARREIRVLFEELLTRLPDIHVIDEPDRLSSAFINGIKRMHAEFTPAPTSS